MKLYQTHQGTNPRRVSIYLAEKGIDVPRVEVDVSIRAQKSPEFLALNPAGRIPVLELDDGTAITESAAIIEFFEELHPDPPLIGTNPAERARVRALERMGNDLIARAQLWVMHSVPYFADRVRQDATVAAAAKPLVDEILRALEAHIGSKRFLAGDNPTIADCTLFAMFQSCRVRFGVDLGVDQPRLTAWYQRFESRPSAAY